MGSGCGDCDGIRRARVSPIANTIVSTAITSGTIPEGTVAGTCTLDCVSLCNGGISRIVQAKIVEYSATSSGLQKPTLDLYLFKTQDFTATTGTTLTLTAEEDWVDLVGVIPFSQGDYKRIIGAGTGYITYAWADFDFAKGYLKQVKTDATKSLYGVLVNESGKIQTLSGNNYYLELTVEK